jgi:hypothetical protein
LGAPGTVTEAVLLWLSGAPFRLDVPCATAGAEEMLGIAGMMGFCWPFTGETEFDFACCDEPVATRGAFEPVATSGVEDGFLDAPTAEA